MSPDHILGKSMLKMSLQDLHQFVETQVAQNPALVMDDEERCPACGCTLIGSFCPACGSESLVVEEEDDSEASEDDWQERILNEVGSSDEEYYEPFSHVASPHSLNEHLKDQLQYAVGGETRQIAEFLVDSLESDGYLREPLIDIASRFKVSVPQLEEVLVLVQNLEPAGIGARDLQECMLIQIARLDDDEKSLAEKIIRDHWENFVKLKINRIANALKVHQNDIFGAIGFIKNNLTPHPANGFRDPWDKLAPRTESKQAPDVRIRAMDDGLVAEMLDPITGRVIIDEAYSDLYSEIVKKKSGYSENDSAHIKECVQTARALIDALEFRKGTIQHVAEELIRLQSDFILKGPAYLRPLTKKELAQKVGVHESTICRATTDKVMQLPSGEVIQFDTFFDSAIPVRELVRKFATQKNGSKALSDGEIAVKLNELGITIARRTVAKYRDQLHLLPVEYRIAS